MESLVESRHDSYGHPAKNLPCIADMWGIYLARRADAASDGWLELNELDVAVLNILQKISRIANTPDHLDSWDDIQGYAECAKKCLAAKE